MVDSERARREAQLAAVVQPAGKVHKIGFLHMSSTTAVARNFEAFQQGLRELGSIEGQNLVIGMERGEGVQFGLIKPYWHTRVEPFARSKINAR